MRDRLWLVLGVAVIALAVGLAAGWWLRGDDTKSLQASSGVEPAVQVPTPELRPAAESSGAAKLPRQKHRERLIAESADRDKPQGEAPAAPPTRRVSRSPVTSASGSEPPLDTDLRTGGIGEVEDMDAEQRARYRSEDFDEFGDGPVEPDPTAEPARSTKTPGSDCLALGMPGCQRDVDCCGVAVCRTRAGEIAGFRECREAP